MIPSYLSLANVGVVLLMSRVCLAVSRVCLACVSRVSCSVSRVSRVCLAVSLMLLAASYLCLARPMPGLSLTCPRQSACCYSFIYFTYCALNSASCTLKAKTFKSVFVVARWRGRKSVWAPAFFYRIPRLTKTFDKHLERTFQKHLERES